MSLPTERLARSAGLAGLATLASRILGLVRDQVLAAVFGAGNEMDAFLVAFRIPNLVRDLFAEGAMSAAFVPTFTRRLTRGGKADAWRLGSSVITALIVITGVLVALGVVFARPLVSAYASDYRAVPGKLELTIELTRVMLPFLTLAAIAAAFMGMLNSLHHYFVPALSPAMFNVVTIACALLLVPFMPALGLPRIMAIAIAAILGGVGQIAVQWFPLRREGFRYRAAIDLGGDDAGVRRVLMLMGPGTLGLAATQVNLIVNTLLATSQGTGAVSWLTYAFRLMYLPIGLFGVSIATAVLPAASRHAAVDDTDALRTTVSRGLRLMLMLNVPATLGLLVLATPIVRLLFERGRFLPADTVHTAAALQFYAVGLVGYATARILSPVFYAVGRSRTPALVSVFTIAINVVLSVTLVRLIGFRGLALGTSIAATANGGVLLWLLRRHLRGLEGARLLQTGAKVAIAALVMAALAVAVDRFASAVAPGAGTIPQAVRLFATIMCALAALGAAATLLRIEEFDDAAGRARLQLREWLGR
jgi:putative peptidoglycan lipid II flippase